MGAYHFGKTSKERLATCHEDIQRILNAVMEDSPEDFTVVCGHRKESAQNEAYETGRSNAHWPDSNHNLTPSFAIDVAPYRDGAIVWGDIKAFRRLGERIVIKANELGIPIRWGRYFKCIKGGDWPHFELI